MNWPAGLQEGKSNQRDTPSTTVGFGDPKYTGPTVWQTFRGKVEIFPGNADERHRPDIRARRATRRSATTPSRATITPSSVNVSPSDPSLAGGPTPWINLDETDQITLDSMYAGVVAQSSSPGNSRRRSSAFWRKPIVLTTPTSPATVHRPIRTSNGGTRSRSRCERIHETTWQRIRLAPRQAPRHS